MGNAPAQHPEREATMSKPYWSKHGPIPDDRWENEPCPPGPLSDFMSTEQIAALDAHFDRILREIECERVMKGRRK